MKATTTPVPGARPCEYDRSRTYGWNGENRLISAENGDTRLEFSYDYMGRRFEKKVYTANVLTKHEKFVYDGYKLIQVLDALNDNAVTMTFVWHPESTGLDTPFSMMYDGETYYYVTDGNKNVMSLIDAAGTKVAEYVYDPFGRPLSSTGSLAEINPFRFSSEYHDDETGLVYYNYRYYSPELGRWISRDPIEEEGGVNLYAMVGNEPINYWDYLGLRILTVIMNYNYSNNINSFNFSAVKAEVERTLNECHGRCDLKRKHSIKFKWIAIKSVPHNLGYDPDPGWFGSHECITTVTLYLNELTSSAQRSPLGYSGAKFRAAVNLRKVIEQYNPREQTVSRDIALGQIIAHEIFFHGITGRSDYSGSSSSSDIDGGGGFGTGGKKFRVGATFSADVCNDIGKELGLITR